MAVGAEIVERIRARIKEQTQFHCSAGVGANKVIAKLVCARHKPKQQTIICSEFVSAIFETTPIRSVRSLGGKLGKQLMTGFDIQVAVLAMIFLFLFFRTFDNQLYYFIAFLTKALL